MPPIRVALIGCGAVVGRSHVPALLNNDKFSIEVLVDQNLDQAKEVQSIVDAPFVTTDFRTALDHFDLAVVATPSATHFSLGVDLLRESKHVLMEKPIATSASEASELVQLASEKKCLLAVSLVRRYSPHFALFKQLMTANVIGPLESFTITEGGVFNWPVQSSDFYKASASGGGVLIDHGAHILDACLWWFGDYQAVKYADDFRGGVEADCRLRITLKNGAKGEVTMSRIRSMPGSVTANGAQARIKLDLNTGEISLKAKHENALSFRGHEAQMSFGETLSTVSLFSRQYSLISDYLTDQSVSTDLVQGQDCLRSIELIEECYLKRSSADYEVWS